MATPVPVNRACFSTRDVAAITHGSSSGAGGERVHHGITTDSRAVVAGGAFVALRGETHDGHAFLGAAARNGATLLVVEAGRGPEAAAALTAPGQADIVEVPDTLVAWGELAREHLLRWRAKPSDRGARSVVAITGSTGKTTTKTLCAALLSTEGSVRMTDGNLNNRIGVPAMIFTLEPEHQMAILECGMSLPGEMAVLSRITSPDVAAVVNVGMAHAENLGGTREGVGFEKAAIYTGLASDGVLVANADDPLALANARTWADGRAVKTFGRSEEADVRLLERVPLGINGSTLRVARRGQAPFDLEIPMVGEGAALDFVCALASAEAAVHGPLDLSRAAAALKSLQPSQGRASVRRRADGAVIIDDTYNANPQSMQNALESLSELARAEGRRAVCVLGEMLELGPIAESAHDAVGDLVASSGAALFVGCGGLMNRAIERAARAGVRTIAASDAAAAARAALNEVGPRDLVLVKGSRSVGTERVVFALMGENGS